jgi:hypothetical protein
MALEILAETDELFVLKEVTLGGLEDELGPSFFILLRSFDLNSNVMRAVHLEVLRDRVVPFLQRSSGFAEIYAMADRSGPPQVNYEVSERRLVAVQQSLMQLGAPLTKVHHGFAKATGEDFFEHLKRMGATGHRFDDGNKDAKLRMVAVGLTPAPIGVPTRAFQEQTALLTTSFGRLYAGHLH